MISGAAGYIYAKENGPKGPLFLINGSDRFFLAKNLKGEGQDNERSDNGAEYFVHEFRLIAKNEHIDVSYIKNL